MLIGLIFLFYSLNSFSAVYTTDASYVYLHNDLTYYHDNKELLSFVQIKEQNFTANSPGGFFEGNMWAKGTICHQGDDSLHLIYKDPIEEVDFYILNQVYKHRFLSGNGLAKHYWVNFEFNLQGCSEFYVKVKSGDVINFNFLVVGHSRLNTVEAVYSTFYGFFFTVISIVFLISLIFLYSIQEKSLPFLLLTTYFSRLFGWCFIERLSISFLFFNG